MQHIADAAAALATGRISAASLVDAALDRIADPGGSGRVPAAMCGVVGYKPTARRVPIQGVLPLAPSLDSVGPLARSVACCHLLDAAISGEESPKPLARRPVA